MTAEMLRVRLLEAPEDEADLRLGARDTQGQLVGVAFGAHALGQPELAGVRWVGALPGWAARGLEAELLEVLLERLRARGARRVRLMATPPRYIRPGLDIRRTALLAALLERGWTHAATHFNMTVDLQAWQAPPPETIWACDARGYAVRRARLEDREPFRAWMSAVWTATWREEADLAFGMAARPLYLAWQGDRIVGFAACEVSQCVGGFGPTGVAEAHRGAGLGRRLLWACLDHLQRAGRTRCEIGWVGPVAFYHRACGAVLGPVYWVLEREL